MQRAKLVGKLVRESERRGAGIVVITKYELIDALVFVASAAIDERESCRQAHQPHQYATEPGQSSAKAISPSPTRSPLSFWPSSSRPWRGPWSSLLPTRSFSGRYGGRDRTTRHPRTWSEKGE